MRRRAWKRAAALFCLTAAVAAVVLVTARETRRATAALADSAAEAASESPRSGLVAELPYVGTLRWRCAGERRFFTTLTPPSPGATVFVGVRSDGKRIWRNRRVDPRPPEPTVAGPFRARRRQTWTIRYHHAPATVKVIARLRFAAPRADAECLVSSAKIETRRTPH
jgi:hypothetical protein